MSMLLTFLMVFTTVMPYTAFAEDSVLTDGAGDMELVGVSSGANGTEAEIVDASGDGESSLITDQADASSASGAQGSDSSAASGAGSDGSADASLDGLFEDEPDAASTDTAASEDTGAANTYLNEDTRTVYLVNRNSYADLQLWNENKTGDEADFWVQHVEKADNEHPYTLFGSDDKSGSAAAGSSSDASTVAASAATASAPADAIPASGNDNTSGAAAASSASGTTAADTSYRFEEVKMTNTGYKDSKGGDIYTAQIPESWDYVTFAYFADDSDLTEATRIDEAGYPQGVAANGRHRTMVIKVSDKKNYIVGVPLTKDEATLAGLSAGDMIWKALEIEKKGMQAFYVNAEHFEDANGNIYRKPMAERLDAAETEESETASETTETQSETAVETTETQSETATETTKTAEETETEKATETEKVTETEEATETETEAVVLSAKKNTLGVWEESAEEYETANASNTYAADGKVRIYFKAKKIHDDGWWQNAVYIYAWGSNGNTGYQKMNVATDYKTTDGTTLYYYDLDSTYNSGLLFTTTTNSSELGAQNQTDNATSFKDGDCFWLASTVDNGSKQTLNSPATNIDSVANVEKISQVQFDETSKSLLHYSEASGASLNSSTIAFTASDEVAQAIKAGTYSVSWESSNKDVVTVAGTEKSESATLTTVAAGKSTVTATVKNGSTTIGTASIEITVTQAALAYFDPSTLSMTYSSDSVAGSSNSTNVTLKVEDSVAQNISDGTYTVTWDSSNNTVVSHSTAGTALTETLTSHKASADAVNITATVKDGETVVATATLPVTVTADTSKIIYYLAPSDWTRCYAFFTTDMNGAAVDSSNKFTGMTQYNDTSLVVMDDDTTSIKNTTNYSDYNLFFVKVPSTAQYVIFRNSDVVNSNQSWSGAQEPTGNNIYLSATFSGDKNGYVYSGANSSGKNTTVTGNPHKFTLREGVWIDAGSNTMNWSDGEPETLPLTLKQGNLDGQITKVEWSSTNTNVLTVPANGDGDGTTTATVTSAGAGIASIKAKVTITKSDGTEEVIEDTTTTSHPELSYSITVTEKKYIYYLAPDSWTGAYAVFQDSSDKNIGLNADGTNYKNADGRDSKIFRQMSEVDDSTIGMDGGELPSGYTLYRIEVPADGTNVIFLSKAAWNNDQDPTSGNVPTAVSGTRTINGTLKNDNGYWQKEKGDSTRASRGHYFGKRTGIWITPATSTLSLIEGASDSEVLTLGVGPDVPAGYTVNWTVEGTDAANIVTLTPSGDTAIVKTNKSAGTATVKATLTYSDTTVTAPSPATATVTVEQKKRVYYLADDSWTQAYVTLYNASGFINYSDNTVFWPMTKAEGDYLMDGEEIYEGTLFYIDLPADTAATQVIFLDQKGWPANGSKGGHQDPQSGLYGITDNTLGTNDNGKTNNGYQYTGTTSNATAHYFSEAGNTVINPSSKALFLNKEEEAKSGTFTVIPADGLTYASVQWSLEDGTVANVASTSGDKKTSVTVTGLKKGKTLLTANLLNEDGEIVGTASATVIVRDKLQVYYDAEFSKLLYSESGADANKAIPHCWNNNQGSTASDGIINYYAVNASGQVIDLQGNVITNGSMTGTMTKVTDVPSSAKGSWTDMYISDVLPEGTVKVYFANSKGAKTVSLEITEDVADPCFYANTGDDIEYKSGDRGGYWGEAWVTRDHDGTEDVTNIMSGTYPGNSADTYYVNSSFYDYFSDFELNGVSRGKYTGENGASHRNWVTFREFDQALSAYYASTSNQYVMYTGHFQPPYDKWGYQFRDIGYTMNLTGYSGNANNAGSYFYTINNSNPNSSGASGYYKYATQGLWAHSQPYNTYFSTDFLTGNNAKHAKLANIYPSVKFPLKKTNEYVNNQNSASGKLTVPEYYVFDSAKTTLHLAGSGQLYLKDTGNQAWSKNVNSTGGTSGDPVSNTYGFFPLDDTTGTNGKLGTGVDHNYGFGTRIVIPFTLNENGTVTVDGKEVPQVFKFSGDDDVWVFLDGESENDLILDLGGDHGRVNGAINFAKQNKATEYDHVDFLNQEQQEYWVEVPSQNAYVSDVKEVTGVSTGTGKNQGQRTNISKKLNDKNVYDGETHYLYLYYMERGQWESNMRMEMNIKLFTQVTIKKKFVRNGVDVSKNVSGSIYAMIKQKDSKGNSVVYAVNPSGTTTKSKYCVEISSTNDWTTTIGKLPAKDSSNGDYTYTAQEVLMSNGEPVAMTGDGSTDNKGIAYPKAATKGDAVVVDGQAYIVQDAQEDSGSFTLVNTRIATTALKVAKRFLGTDADTIAKSIKVKIQRQAYTGTETDLAKISAAMKSDKWEDVTIDGQGTDGWYELTAANTTSSTETDSSGNTVATVWNKTFDKLMINPENDATKGVYVYRVLEKSASGDTGSAADSGSAVTYTDADGGEQSYWVYYSGSENNSKYNLYKANTDNTGNTATLTNKLIPTQLTIKKVWSGTDKSTRPTSIKIKVQRAELSNYVKDKLALPTDKDELANISWTDLSLSDLNVTTSSDSTLSQDADSKWITWKSETNAGETWTKTFSNLPIAPENGTASGRFYVYRIIEASNGTAQSGYKEAADGGSATYKTGTGKNGSEVDSSYFVSYTIQPVAVTRSGNEGAYTYSVTQSTKSSDNSKYINVGESTIKNTLIVHLPSTGSRTGLTLTILSLICLAAAGSFGIFGRKRRLIA